MSKIANSLDEFSSENKFFIVLNTEGLYFLIFDRVFREIVQSSDVIFVDGVGLQVVLKLFGYSKVNRLHGPDLFRKYLYLETGSRRLILGGSAKAHKLLFDRHPYLQDSKDHLFNSDFIDPSNLEDIFDLIRSFKPTEIFLCLGIRKQELVGSIIKKEFAIPKVVGVGAAIDFESGNVKRSSSFFQKIGLEWLPRLIKEPRMIPRVYRSLCGLTLIIFIGLVRLRNPFRSLKFYK
jgi:N-acetylglucosaminyldiphosphoundecaprenol N-acetyl-beta-D-mannosaminyltransferase